MKINVLTLLIVFVSGPKRNAFSVEQSQGWRVWSAIKSNVLDHSVDEDKYQEETGQRKAMKYVRKTCYHCIEYSATNSLTA